MDFTADVEIKSETDFLEFTNPNNGGPPIDPSPLGTAPPPPVSTAGPEHSNIPLTSSGPSQLVHPPGQYGTASGPDGQPVGPAEEPKEPAKVYSCEVCNIPSMSEQNHDFHMKGQRHQKNMRHRQMGLPIIGPQYGGVGRRPAKKAEIEALFQHITEPIIGLSYVSEHQKEGQSVEHHYECELCNSNMDPRVITSHVVGYKHRLAYMEKHYPEFHQAVVNERKKRSEASAQIEQFARQIEEKEGRGEVKVKTELNPFIKSYKSRTTNSGNPDMEPVVGNTPNHLMCKACNIVVNGPSVWEQHIRGTRHQKNVGLDPATAGKESVVTVNKRAIIQDEVDRFSGKPLVGVEYIEEFQKTNSNVEPRYVCTLCEGKCDPRTLFSHITGSKHRINYIKKHLPETGKTLFTGDAQNMKKSEVNPILEKIAEEIESKEGRKAVIVKIDKNDFVQPIESFGKRKVEGANNGGPPSKFYRGGRGGRGNFDNQARGGTMGRGRGMDSRGRGGGGGFQGRGGGPQGRGRGGGGGGRGMDMHHGFSEGRGRARGRGDPRGRGRGQTSMLGRGRGRGGGGYDYQGQEWQGDYTTDRWDVVSEPREEFPVDQSYNAGFDRQQGGRPMPRRGFGRTPVERPMRDRYDEPAPPQFDRYDRYEFDRYDAPPTEMRAPTRSFDPMPRNEQLGAARSIPPRSNYFDFTSDQPDMAPLPRDAPPRPPPIPRPPHAPPSGPMPLMPPSEPSTSIGGSSSALAGMLKQMTQCLVNNEDEADVALQVSNALTQALLTYRMKNND